MFCIFFFLAGCKAVGVEDPNKIPNAWMTASSDTGTHMKAYDGRVNMKMLWWNRWCPSTTTDRSDYLQVDIGAVRDVCAVATQCRHWWQHAKTYYLQISVDGVNWNTYEKNKAKKVNCNLVSVPSPWLPGVVAFPLFPFLRLHVG